MSPRVGDILGHWMDRAELSRAVRGVSAVCRWPEAVGPLAAQYARAESLTRGVLTIRVDSGVWATELSAHEPVLLERLNRSLEEPVVIRLKFLVGRGRTGPSTLPEPGAEAPPPVWPRRRDLEGIELSVEERTKVAGLAAAAGDHLDLGQAGARWLATTLKARRWLDQLSNPHERKPERG